MIGSLQSRHAVFTVAASAADLNAVLPLLRSLVGDAPEAHTITLLLTVDDEQAGKETKELELDQTGPVALADRARKLGEGLPLTLRLVHLSVIADAAPRLLAEVNPGLVVIPKTQSTKHTGERWRDELVEAATCDVLTLRSSGESTAEAPKILVPVSTGEHCIAALQVADRLLGPDGTLVALNVRRDSSKPGREVGEWRAAKAITKAGLEVDERHQIQVESGVVDVTEAIARVAREGFTLLLVGASEEGFVQRTLFSTIPERLMWGPEGLSVGVVRRARPLATRVRRRFEAWLERHVPQLEREQRIELYARLEEGSRSHFDFFALTGLATAIASLGLMSNSGAVVIGAMLVAPLMTPMIGAGLGLVQANLRLVQDALRSVGLGFLLAWLLGFVLGWIFSGEMIVAPGASLPAEILARGHPGPLDLFVAILSGLAAAYANARPNLSSALPGVAIAAALVPPIASSGIATAHGDVFVARGAVMLFGANLVAIILGAGLALYAQGVRPGSGESRGRVWSRRILQLLTILALALAFVLGTHVLSKLPTARTAPVTPDKTSPDKTDKR